ncbi:MAG: amidohydrolase [Croceibacterium sp.]
MTETRPIAFPRRTLAALLLSALPLALAAPAMADTLIDNVNGITVDRNGTVTHFEGIVIGDDGRVVQLVDRGERAPRTDFRENMRGRTVIPGIIDAHAHVMELGLALLVVDLSDTHTLAEAQAKIAQFAAANPERPWIVGRGWNQETWGLGRFPTAAELDAAVPDRPVWLQRVDGHAGWANTLALAAAGVTAATADPSGGRVERVAGGRAPAGVLVDNAMALVDVKAPPPRATDRDVALYKAQELLIGKGVTAVADMGTSIEDWMTFRRAGDTGQLRIRIMSYALGVEAMTLIGGSGPTPWLYDDHLRMGGLKLFLDGALGSRGALLKQPYADDPRNRGLERLNGTQLRNLMSRAATEGYQVAVHAIGDAANAEILSAIDELSGDYGGDRRWRIEHAQIVDPVDIPKFGQHGIIASMQPVHETSDRLMAEARLGPDRLAGAYAWRSIHATGAPLAFGSDTPVEAPDAFAGMAAAISRQGPDGQPEGGWHPEETVTREEALAAYTAGAAYAGFAEGHFGRLAVGEKADFIVLDADPLKATPEQLRQIRVIETWIGGARATDSDSDEPSSRPTRAERPADAPGR